MTAYRVKEDKVLGGVEISPGYSTQGDRVLGGGIAAAVGIAVVVLLLMGGILLLPFWVLSRWLGQRWLFRLLLIGVVPIIAASVVKNNIDGDVTVTVNTLLVIGGLIMAAAIASMGVMAVLKLVRRGPYAAT